MTRSSSRFIIRQNKHKLCNLLQTLKSNETHKDTYLNPMYTEYPLKGTCRNNEYIDEMPNGAAFYLSLYCLYW